MHKVPGIKFHLVQLIPTTYFWTAVCTFPFILLSLTSMAIRIKLERTETELFCSSKWWGDPDMPADMEYPFTEDYPLTFICQIACEDIAPYDPEGLLPHEGMFYVFGAVDEYAGYESPVHNGIGLWPRKQIVVKYTKSINFETFRSAIFEAKYSPLLRSYHRQKTFKNLHNNGIL